MYRDLVRSAGKSALARAVALPVGLGSALTTTYLTTTVFGVSKFGLFALIASVPLLLPVIDFGFGAAVTNTISAARGMTDCSIARNLRASVQALTCIGTAVGVVVFICSILGLWPAILGIDRGANYYEIALGLEIGLVLLAMAIPLGLGQRILLGLDRNHVAVLIQTIAPVTTLGLVAVSAYFERYFLALVAPLAGIFASNLVSWFTGVRRLRVSGVSATRLFFGRVGSETWSSIRKLAGPMAIVSASVPLSFYTDRLVLSHFGGLEEVAEYSAVSQVFSPLLSFISVAGLSLWPVFARARESGATSDDKERAYIRILVIFGVVGVLFGMFIFFGGPFVVGIATDGRVVTGSMLYACFGLLVVANAVHFPGGMVLTDRKGLLFQAKVALGMVALNFPIGIYLTILVGASGPVIASVLLLVCVVCVPTIFRVRQTLRAE